MGGKKGQISLEYIIITGFVVLAILVPSFLILFSSTNKNVQGTVNTQKVLDLGKGIINDVKQMYYLGLYSKKIVNYEIPQNVEEMFIVEIYDAITDSKYYYFGLVIKEKGGDKLYTFQSDIPIMSQEINDQVLKSSGNGAIKECQEPNNVCEYYNFIGFAKSPGLKKFKVETVYDSDMAKSKIIPVLQ